MALLDPAMRPVINQAIDDGHLTEAVRNRPGDYIGTETMKVVVLMTDGANTVTRDVRDQYKNGPSRVWFSQQAADATGDWWDGFFIQLPENPDSRYWWQGQEPWDRYDGAYWHRDSLPADAVQWHYTQLYDRFSEFALADLFRDHRYMDDDVLDTLRSQHRSAVYEPNSYGDLDERLNGNGTDTTPDTVFGICDAARRDNDILVFTIAFEAPDGGETQMRRCATANGFYFDAANATALEEAFSAIAGQITKLRLTQ